LPAEGILTDYLLKNERLNISKIVPLNTPRAKRAMLSYVRVAQIQSDDGGLLTLARITLGTGRHHQIRVQLAHANAPLWGDTKYNPAFARRRGVCVALWAERLAFPHPQTQKSLVFECPPGDMDPFCRFF